MSFRTSHFSLATEVRNILHFDYLRLRWKPLSSLATSVHIASSARDPPSATNQAYSQGIAGYHPISKSSLTEPPIYLIKATQANLDEWEDDRVDEYLSHADDESAVWVQGDERNAGTDENPTEDDEHLWDDETGRKLMRCCDEDRSSAQAPSIVVRSSGKPYVTIHDYVTAVHDWLQTHRDDILRAKVVNEDGPVPSDRAFYPGPISIATITLNDGNGTADFAWLWSHIAQYADRLGEQEVVSQRRLGLLQRASRSILRFLAHILSRGMRLGINSPCRGRIEAPLLLLQFLGN
ncbi:hypothetical protein KJ359_008931 [Pestalotiopsis sp. 9143b]|nr:hypothetical protein KJ359_008931 [Pestalotiopsis sp. 9143b]